MPLFAGQYLYTEVLIPVLILSLAALGLNILTGYCGQVSLGTGGFMAVGAYAAYNLALRLPETNIILVFLFAGVMAMLVGMLFGLPSLRIKGFYLAVATLAAQFFLEWAFARVKWFTNYSPFGLGRGRPDRGVRYPDRHARRRTYILVLAIVVVLALAAKNLVRGRIGRMWMAMRDMDIAAEIIGIRPLLCQALRLRGVLVLYRRRRRAVGVPAARLVGAARLRHQPLVPGAVHDHHRRARHPPGLVPRRRLHRAAPDLSQPVAVLARNPDLDRDDLAPRVHGVRRA